MPAPPRSSPGACAGSLATGVASSPGAAAPAGDEERLPSWRAADDACGGDAGEDADRRTSPPAALKAAHCEWAGGGGGATRYLRPDHAGQWRASPPTPVAMPHPHNTSAAGGGSRRAGSWEALRKTTSACAMPRARAPMRPLKASGDACFRQWRPHTRDRCLSNQWGRHSKVCALTRRQGWRRCASVSTQHQPCAGLVACRGVAAAIYLKVGNRCQTSPAPRAAMWAAVSSGAQHKHPEAVHGRRIGATRLRAKPGVGPHATNMHNSLQTPSELGGESKGESPRAQPLSVPTTMGGDAALSDKEHQGAVTSTPRS